MLAAIMTPSRMGIMTSFSTVIAYRAGLSLSAGKSAGSMVRMTSGRNVFVYMSRAPLRGDHGQDDVRGVRLLVVDGVGAGLQAVVMAAEVEGVGVVAGQIDAQSVVLGKAARRGPDLDVESIDLARLDG